MKCIGLISEWLGRCLLYRMLTLHPYFRVFFVIQNKDTSFENEKEDLSAGKKVHKVTGAGGCKLARDTHI